MKEHQEDINFLLNRSLKAGCCSFSSDRDTGISSNSIVAIAYGAKPLEKQDLPSDWSDLKACELMWEQLPSHRKTLDAQEAMRRARAIIKYKYKERGMEI